MIKVTAESSHPFKDHLFRSNIALDNPVLGRNMQLLSMCAQTLSATMCNEVPLCKIQVFRIQSGINPKLSDFETDKILR